MSDPAKFWEIKRQIRILGVDDGPFEFGRGNKALLVGTVFRGGQWLDGVLKSEVEVDGDDGTERIIEMVNKSRHRGQIRVVMTDGLTLGGFNVIDGRDIFRRTGLPVISVTREAPDLEAIETALKAFPDFPRRWERVQQAGEPVKHAFKKRTRGSGCVYFQSFGIRNDDAHSVIEVASTRGLMPEPIRVAHIIASGIVKGESYGRA